MIRKLMPIFIFVLLLCPARGFGQGTIRGQLHVSHPPQVRKPLVRFAAMSISSLQFHPILSLITPAPAFSPPKRSSSSSSNSSIIALMLLLMWIIFAFTYNYNPIYRNSFLRYFTGHSFFVGDVIKRHIRDLYVGISILVQHCISGGIVLYCLFYTLFTPVEQQALYEHYPVLSGFDTGPLAFFSGGFFGVLAIEIIMLIWLWIPHPIRANIGRIFNLYPWMLQLNLITATVMVAVFIPGDGAVLIYLLGSLFAILFNAGFIITCFDMAANSGIKKRWYLAGTLGLYLIALAGLAAWLLASPVLHNMFHLPASLP